MSSTCTAGTVPRNALPPRRRSRRRIVAVALTMLFGSYGAAVLLGMPQCVPFDLAWNVGDVPLDPALQAPSDGTTRLVVLQHGLWRSRIALSRLQRALQAHGYVVCNEGYASTRLTIEAASAQLADAVERAVQAVGGPVEVAYIGHSLGGLVIQDYLRQKDARAPFACVYIGVPHRGAVLCDLRKHWWPFPWIMGTGAALQLSPGDPIHRHAIPFKDRSGAIVGDLGEGNQDIPGDDDGTVAVAESTLQGAADCVVLDTGHTAIASSPVAIRQALHFLRARRFEH